MPATIAGLVFGDLNHNGVFDPGESGVPHIFLTLFNPSSHSCVQTNTDTIGIYSFFVDTAGTYQIYETVSPASDCPPTVFTQPTGFSLSNGPRVLTVTVTAEQVASNATIGAQNFSHDTVNSPLDCTPSMIQFANTPTEWFNINVGAGTTAFQGPLTLPDNVNAIGYNNLDNYLYGYDQTTNHIVRIDRDQLLMQLVPNPTGLPPLKYNVGSFDLDGHLFLMVNGADQFYTVDLKPNSATFMKLVDPANGYLEQTSNFGTALNTTLDIGDWAFNPNDSFLYGVTSVGNTAQVVQVYPTAGIVTPLTTNLPALNPAGDSWGAAAMDASGALFAIYHGDSSVYRFTISGGLAEGARLFNTFSTSFNDGAMCPEALVGPIAETSVVKAASPNPVTSGQPLTYTIEVTNNGPDRAANFTLTDTVPPELLSPEYSLNDGISFLPWTGSLDLGSFPNGASKTVLIRATVDPTATGTISNTAIVGSDASDPNPNNNTSTTETPIAAAGADMAVNKAADLSSVSPGNSLAYTITVSNLGPDAAEGVVLTDTIPSGVTGPEYSIDGGMSFLPWPGSLTLGDVPPGTSQTILIQGTVNPSASGSIVNTAAVSSTTPDPNPDNNTSTVTVTISTFDARCQAITDLIESAALEEAALSHILNAEGEKLQKIAAVPNIAPAVLLQANQSVQSMTNAIALLEGVLLNKLQLFSDCLCGDNVEEQA